MDKSLVKFTSYLSEAESYPSLDYTHVFIKELKVVGSEFLERGQGVEML